MTLVVLGSECTRVSVVEDMSENDVEGGGERQRHA